MLNNSIRRNGVERSFAKSIVTLILLPAHVYWDVLSYSVIETHKLTNSIDSKPDCTEICLSTVYTVLRNLCRKQSS